MNRGTEQEVLLAAEHSPQVAGLRSFVDQALEPVLVMLDPAVEHLRQAMPDAVTVLTLPAGAVPGSRRWGTILLAVPDRDALRRTASGLPPTGSARRIAVWVDETDRAVSLSPTPDWPVLTHLNARRIARRSALTVAVFGDRASGRTVLGELARQSVFNDVGNRGLRVAVQGDASAPPGDVKTLRLATVAQAGDPELVVPPDVVVTSGARDLVVPEHPVIGRAPMVVDDTAGPLALGPLDERILNPIGFLRQVEDATPTGDAELVVTQAGPGLRRGGDILALDTARGATEALVRDLRQVRAVHLSWPEVEHRGLARLVAGLAMTGVPLVSPMVPPWAAALLGPGVSTALAAEVDLSDVLAREEYSIVQRRAALGEFASYAWRAKVGVAAGVRVASHPSVSVVLATRRPQNLEPALRQVSRQRGVELELVLAAHGFDVDEARVRDLLDDHVQLTLAPQPEETLFGDVLAHAGDAASGDLVLKMDDDDWYGPDVVSDLVLARTYSGAELVGMPAEFFYLEPLRRTVRRHEPTELYTRFVAGGTMMLARATLRSLGGFRAVRRYVDASLISDVLGAGGTVYRAHGLGYVLRRGESGHTWQVDVETFLSHDRLAATHEGFVPSRLLEADPRDLP